VYHPPNPTDRSITLFYKKMNHTLSILIFFSLVLLKLDAAEAPSLRGLEPNQSLVVRYTSSGCFHNSTDIIVFESGQASIYSVESKWGEDKKELVEVNRKLLGVVKLSDDDITKLDALFKFYAGGPNEGCTTVDQITASLKKNDKVVKTYEFSDGSCETYDLKSVLTFGALKDRIKKKHAEQGGDDQPATAPELKSEGKDKPQPESKVAPR
jgi:hypothetical protein